ncbi:hypothetical protein JCM9492_08240 [Aquifex pyrophilus]
MGLSFYSFTYSTVDVPGRWSLVLFLPSCNFRCRHCHNWRIVLKSKGKISEEEALKEVRRAVFIDTVVISGGEPTVHKTEELKEFIKKVKSLRKDLSVRIDTNGYYPEKLEELRPFVDGFAVDIKAPLENEELYAYTTNVNVDTKRIKESLKIAEGLPLTLYRTPKYPWLKEREIKAIKSFTKSLKAPWYLNPFYEVPDCPFNKGIFSSLPRSPSL